MFKQQIWIIHFIQFTPQVFFNVSVTLCILFLCCVFLSQTGYVFLISKIVILFLYQKQTFSIKFKHKRVFGNENQDNDLLTEDNWRVRVQGFKSEYIVIAVCAFVFQTNRGWSRRASCPGRQFVGGVEVAVSKFKNYFNIILYHCKKTHVFILWTLISLPWTAVTVSVWWNDHFLYSLNEWIASECDIF